MHILLNLYNVKSGAYRLNFFVVCFSRAFWVRLVLSRLKSDFSRSLSVRVWLFESWNFAFFSCARVRCSQAYRFWCSISLHLKLFVPNLFVCNAMRSLRVSIELAVSESQHNSSNVSRRNELFAANKFACVVVLSLRDSTSSATFYPYSPYSSWSLVF